ncbi:MAG: DUF4832 domain-containing protein [Lachnospiraceae bacterium]|nr:DUF4832 domain-containing protein [Lachnospiraceae bacterium]
MDKKRKVRHLLLSVMVVILGAAVFAFSYMKKTYYWEESQEVFDNPGIGFAASADNEEAARKTSLVYVDITWREWEPSQGNYNYQQVVEENHLEQWRSLGKEIVLRFVSDIPGKEQHLDIPNWLYLLTGGDGTYYSGAYGSGYSPNYNNDQLITCHREAILALGSYFAGDPHLSYVELGSLGHWGEWHTTGASYLPEMPSDEVCQHYVDAYREAFPRQLLLMRRPYQLGKEAGFGVYNDMTGSREDTKEWLGWIESGDPKNIPTVTANPRIWEYAPVGGEFISQIPMTEMLGEELQETLRLIRASHMSFLGPKCPVSGDGESTKAYEAAVDAVKRELGYRFYIPDVELSCFSWSSTCRLKVTIKNTGNAPFYKKWPLMAKLVDVSGQVLEKKQLMESVFELGDGEEKTRDVTLSKLWWKEDNQIIIYIENPDTGEPGVILAQQDQEKRFLCLSYKNLVNRG